MLAGFALGLVVSAVGEPRRLARQLFGVTDGFFGPLFFVWLGASLQVRELGEHPWLILLGVGLGVGAVLAHSVGRLFGLPLTLAVLSAAQLGVPVAAATLGTEQHLLAPGESSALMLGALVTIASTSIAGMLAARRQSASNASG
jgi:Kef-type K+ transport system membrane component KefB